MKQAAKQNSLEKIGVKSSKLDTKLLGTVLFLCAVGCIFIFNASFPKWVIKIFDDPYRILTSQIVSIGVGIVLMMCAIFMPLSQIKKISTLLFIFSVILLVLVFIPGIGVSLGGAARWINLRFMTFQPVELAKLTTVIYIAAWLYNKKEELHSFSAGFIPFGIIIGLICFLLFLQPDAGDAVLIAGIAMTIFFLAGANIYYLAIFGVLTAIVFYVTVLSAGYRASRISVWLNPQSASDTQGLSYQGDQALLALGTGGLLGRGWGKNLQGFFLPEAHNDFIIAIVGEETGMVGVAVILLAILYVAYRGFRIALLANDKFTSLLASGISVWISYQTLINISVVLGILPNKGIPLPFISAGGSSIMILLLAVGVLLNCSTAIHKPKTH